jgi:hypothetical protein
MFDQAIWRCGQHAGCNIDPAVLYCSYKKTIMIKQSFPKRCRLCTLRVATHLAVHCE